MPKPAQKAVDEMLFNRTSPAIKNLNKRARAELRLKARKEWKEKHGNS